MSAEPTGYGLGKSGWLTLTIEGPNAPTDAELRAWIEESYLAVAPKTLVRELDGGASEKALKPPRPKRKS